MIVGGVFTVSTAAVLFVTPTLFVATHWNKSPFADVGVSSIVSVVLVFPMMFPDRITFVKFAPPFVDTCHCSVGAGFPVVATVKFTVSPTFTVTFAGCVVNAGANCTVSTTAFDVTAPATFDTTHW